MFLIALRYRVLNGNLGSRTNGKTSIMHTIDIISDVSCPWCIIGYSALKSAIDDLGFEDKITINWKPFELNPTMPAEGQERSEHIMQKYGSSREQAKQNLKTMADRGLVEGYQFNFAEEGRIYNTFDAHRLIRWAAQFDKQTELKLALFDLHFKNNGDPSNRAQLLSVVEEVGLDTALAAQVLDSDEFADEVRAEEQWNHQNGISAVPTFIFDNQYMVSGGQPKDSFKQVLTHITEQANENAAS